MVQRARCPLCGMMCWPSQIKKSYDFQVYNPVSLGKAHGFRFELTDDVSLLEIIKWKVKNLYEKFFHDISTLSSIASSMNPIVISMLNPKFQNIIYPELR